MKNAFAAFVAVLLFCLLAGPGQAQPIKVDVELARQIVDSNANGGKAGYEFVENTLNQLSKSELEKLKQIIRADMESEAGKIVYPPLSMAENALATNVLHKIDELLGCLRYAIVAEGKFTDFEGAGIAVSDYTFTCTDGQALKFVAVSAATLMPHYDYQENYADYVRVYLQDSRYDNLKNTRYFVIKLVLVQNNSSAPKKILLPKFWTS